MSPSRDEASGTTLPPSVEEAYKRKCIALRTRMREVEEANDQFRLRRERLVRGIRKMRLERAILLETLGKRMKKKGPHVLDGVPGSAGAELEETDDSTDSPPTPQERPMRLKRPHRRNDHFANDADGNVTPSRSGMHGDDYGYQNDADGGDGGGDYGEAENRGLPEHDMHPYAASRDERADEDGNMNTAGGRQRPADDSRRGYEGEFGEDEGEGDGDETMQD